MRNFFTSAKPVSMAEVSSKNGGGDRSGKLLFVYGNQQKIRNYENFGTNLGLNRIPEVLIENGSVINGNVSVLKKWNKEEFGDLAFRKKCLLSELLGLDAREDLSGLSQDSSYSD